MAEYIEREATKKLFCEKCKGYYDGHCIHRGECDVDVIETAPAADVQPVDRWISVKDKMPDVNTVVIGCDRNNGVGEMTLMKNGQWYRNGMSWSADSILYWQPLPEPPKATE